MSTKKQIDLVIGTRPNIIKAAPLYKALAASEWAQPRLVFLQQHTDPVLSTQTMEDVDILRSQMITVPLEGAHYGDRFGCMISRYADVITANRPAIVTVFGDVDTTLAAAIAAKREHCMLAHVEAGLRSHDHEMPEELNRLMVDSIADLHLTTTAEARDTLLREGHPESSVHFVGNLMIDSLLSTVSPSLADDICAKLGLIPRAFLLATFHRPANVDNHEGLAALASMLRELTERMPVLLPLHPRTRAAIERNGMQSDFDIPNLIIAPPMRYKEFVSLQLVARGVISDSGGIQEECAVLGIMCLTIRDTTERPDTLASGNELSSTTEAANRLDVHLLNPTTTRVEIPLWDGQAAARSVAILKSFGVRQGCQ